MPKKIKQLKKPIKHFEKRVKKPVYFIHKTAIVEENVTIGKDSRIWHFCHIRRGTKIGSNCNLGKSVFIDSDSRIGDNVKIQNHAIIYHQAIIENGVFIGPNVCFTNDKTPRAINPDGSPKSADDWEVSTIQIGEGASLGGHSVLTPGVTIGKWAMVGAGSVVTKDVPDFALVYGNPAKIHDFICQCGKRLRKILKQDQHGYLLECSCKNRVIIPVKLYKQVKNITSKKIWLR